MENERDHPETDKGTGPDHGMHHPSGLKGNLVRPASPSYDEPDTVCRKFQGIIRISHRLKLSNSENIGLYGLFRADERVPPLPG